MTLTLDKARELADALLSVVDSIEFVSRRNYACAAPAMVDALFKPVSVAENSLPLRWKFAK